MVEINRSRHDVGNLFAELVADLPQGRFAALVLSGVVQQRGDRLRFGAVSRAVVTGSRVRPLPTLRPVGRELRVDTAGAQAMATHWSASVGDLNETAAPTGLGLPSQTSAAAVDAAHVDVAAFTAGLAARVGQRATGVVQADTSYLAQEAASTAAVAAIFLPAISE